jgi:hypothetical protein
MRIGAESKSNVKALQRLMKAKLPPLKRARCKQTAKAFYGFGDASGSGFGATIQVEGVFSVSCATSGIFWDEIQTEVIGLTLRYWI